jgi:hypothetical protein
MRIEGVAHPRAGRADGLGDADMNTTEIETEQLGGAPLLEEHDPSLNIGTCLASWNGVDGSLRVEASVEDPVAIEAIRSGRMRGLSLGTDMILGADGGVIDRAQRELSVCAQGRRHGTWIDKIDGKRVHRYERASSARRPNPRARALLAR